MQFLRLTHRLDLRLVRVSCVAETLSEEEGRRIAVIRLKNKVKTIYILY